MNNILISHPSILVWRYGLFFGIALCLLLVLSKNYKTIGFAATAFWAYVLVWALFIVEYPILFHGAYSTMFQTTAGQVLIEALIIPLAALCAPKSLWKLVTLAVAAEIVCIWTGKGIGFQGWTSFDTAFIALCLPFVHWGVGLVALATIASHHGSTAFVIIIAQCFAYAIKVRKVRKYLLLLVPAFLYLSHKHQLNAWFDSGERLATYKRFMTFWWTSGEGMSDVGQTEKAIMLSQPLWQRLLVGTGPGTFMWLSAMLSKFQPPIWLQLHSDWLQILFELGLAGFLLAIATVSGLIKRAWSNKKLFAAVMGLIAFGITYHPLRFFPSAFICAMIASEVYRLRSKIPRLDKVSIYDKLVKKLP